MNKQRIFEIVEGTKKDDHRASQYEYFITILVFISVAALFFETFQGLYNRFELLFGLSNLLITIVFTFDYFARVWTADLKFPKLTPRQARKKYVFSSYGIIDALATFPPYFSLFTTANLSIFRVLRIVRLLRLSKLQRVNQALSLFGGVFNRKKTELTMTFSVVLALIFLAGLLMFYAEHDAQPDKFVNAGSGLWWAVITLTTIGYGDLYPITPIGRLLGGLIGLLGIGVIALPTGILSSGLMDELQARRELLEKHQHSKSSKRKKK